MNNELMSRATYYLQGGGIQDQLFRAREQFMERLSMLRPWEAPAAQIPVASRRMVDTGVQRLLKDSIVPPVVALWIDLQRVRTAAADSRAGTGESLFIDHAVRCDYPSSPSTSIFDRADVIFDFRNKVEIANQGVQGYFSEHEDRQADFLNTFYLSEYSNSVEPPFFSQTFGYLLNGRQRSVTVLQHQTLTKGGPIQPGELRLFRKEILKLQQRGKEALFRRSFQNNTAEFTLFYCKMLGALCSTRGRMTTAELYSAVHSQLLLLASKGDAQEVVSTEQYQLLLDTLLEDLKAMGKISPTTLVTVDICDKQAALSCVR